MKKTIVNDSGDIIVIDTSKVVMVGYNKFKGELCFSVHGVDTVFTFSVQEEPDINLLNELCGGSEVDMEKEK